MLEDRKKQERFKHKSYKDTKDTEDTKDTKQMEVLNAPETPTTVEGHPWIMVCKIGTGNTRFDIRLKQRKKMTSELKKLSGG